MSNIKQISEEDKKKIQLKQNAADDIKTAKKHLNTCRLMAMKKILPTLIVSIGVSLLVPNEAVSMVANMVAAAAIFSWIMCEIYIHLSKKEIPKQPYVEIQIKKKLPFEKDPEGKGAAYLPVIGVDTTTGHEFKIYVNMDIYSNSVGNVVKVPVEDTEGFDNSPLS